MRRIFAMSLVVASLIVVSIVVGCAHRRPVADIESLTTASDTFFRFLRWGDLRGASQLIVHESQKGWLDRAFEAREDENLKVTEVEPDEIKLTQRGGMGVCKVTWHRLPSVTTRSERVKVEWVERGGIWFIRAIVDGPLPLAAPAMGADGPDAGR